MVALSNLHEGFHEGSDSRVTSDVRRGVSETGCRLL
jgi:hypothetical protein